MSVLAFGALAGPAMAQEGRGPVHDARRERLEARVRGQFMAQVAERLDLSREERDALEAVLEEGHESRRALAEESRSLRMELVAAVRSDDTPLADFETLLARLKQLRQREWALAAQEDERLAEILDARQQTIFLFMRMQFNERVRGMRGPGPMGGPPGGPPGGPRDGIPLIP
jgi:Spy/CpxP family protein refolding chaperone